MARGGALAGIALLAACQESTTFVAPVLEDGSAVALVKTTEDESNGHTSLDVYWFVRSSPTARGVRDDVLVSMPATAGPNLQAETDDGTVHAEVHRDRITGRWHAGQRSGEFVAHRLPATDPSDLYVSREEDIPCSFVLLLVDRHGRFEVHGSLCDAQLRRAPASVLSLDAQRRHLLATSGTATVTLHRVDRLRIARASR